MLTVRAILRLVKRLMAHDTASKTPRHLPAHKRRSRELRAVALALLAAASTGCPAFVGDPYVIAGADGAMPDGGVAGSAGGLDPVSLSGRADAGDGGESQLLAAAGGRSAAAAVSGTPSAGVAGVTDAASVAGVASLLTAGVAGVAGLSIGGAAGRAGALRGGVGGEGAAPAAGVGGEAGAAAIGVGGEGAASAAGVGGEAGVAIAGETEEADCRVFSNPLV